MRASEDAARLSSGIATSVEVGRLVSELGHEVLAARRAAVSAAATPDATTAETSDDATSTRHDTRVWEC